MKMDWHDGLLRDFACDFRAATARAVIDAYPNPQVRQRQTYTLTFAGVTEIIVTADLAEMQSNAFAGTIVHLQTTAAGRVTKIYLTGGLVSIRCAKMTISDLLPRQAAV